MRFVAFSDAHVASKVGQRMLQYKVNDYKNIRTLLQQLLQKPPDAVVNLGDWWEPLYDRSIPTGDIFDLYAELARLCQCLSWRAIVIAKMVWPMCH